MNQIILGKGYFESWSATRNSSMKQTLFEPQEDCRQGTVELHFARLTSASSVDEDPAKEVNTIGEIWVPRAFMHIAKKMQLRGKGISSKAPHP